MFSDQMLCKWWRLHIFKCLFFLVFLRYQYENEQLPLTSVASWQILRASYTMMQCKSSHLAKPTLGGPSQHGWIWNDENGVYDPVMTELNHVPESIDEVSICKCTIGCLTQRCKCKRNGFVCSELCHCKSCENIEENLYLEDFVADC